MPQRRPWLPICAAASLAAGLFCAGCVKDRPATPDRPIATDIDPATAAPDYWYAKPATQSVAASDYNRLLAQCEETLRARRFVVDRSDYRSGIVESRPLVSKQCWEFWRGDVVDWKDLEQSSLATYRRSVRWQVTRLADGQFQASPKVVVEHFTAPTQRITTVVNYRATLSQSETQTSITRGNLSQLGVDNWYAVGRDEALERRLADDLRQQLAAK